MNVSTFARVLFGLLAASYLFGQHAWAEPGLLSPQEAKEAQKTSFEKLGNGTFQSLETSLGVWTTQSGQTVIDDRHAKTGKQCLHLKGGEQNVVVLHLAPTVDTSGNLQFAAERWTVRRPFSFRIEKQVKGKWSEIYNGDRIIKVGRPFLSNVTVPLNDPSIEQLRFSVTSPANTGILLDDFEIGPPVPQRVVGIENIPFVLPALHGSLAAPLVKIRIDTVGGADPVLLEAMSVSLKLSQFKSVQMYYTGGNGNFSSTQMFGPIQTENEKLTFEECNQKFDRAASKYHQKPIKSKSTSLKEGSFFLIEGKQKLREGANYFWITGQLKESISIDEKVQADFDRVLLSRSGVDQLHHFPSRQRTGVSVRHGGDDAFHTYRIPGLATTNKGTLIGVYDARRNNGGDLPGNIDVGMSRSTDGGQSWEPMKIIMDMGADPKWNFDGIGDPTVLVDRKTGTIWVSATWSHGNRSWVGSGQGLQPEETGQWMLVKSEDDGVTWSNPINITQQIKKPEWCFLLQGPGKGITMADGTLVFPAQYQDPPNTKDRKKHRLPHSTIVYSRDHGETWQTGTGAYADTTESQVVELEDGTLMLNCRYNRESRRVVMITDDLGKTWNEHVTHRKSLIEPRACMASLINVGRELKLLKGIDKHQDLLLFSNPNSLNGRNHITIKASLDGGLTWPKENQILLDEQNSAGYSCMSMIDENTVGILYEGSQAHLTFQRVKIAEILSPPRGDKNHNPALSSLIFDESELNPNRDGHLTVARVFGDNMVLQAQQPIRFWGRAKKNAEVKINFANANATTVADQSGHWKVELPAMPYLASPNAITIQSESNSVIIKNVLVGEVWLCAGQSNMEWPLHQSDNGQTVIQNSSNPQMRLLNFTGSSRGGSGSYGIRNFNRLTSDLFGDGQWQVADPDSSASFSAVGFFFARKIQSRMKCPVGIINVSLGGTPIEAWVGKKWLAADSSLAKMVDGNWLENKSLDDWCKQRAKSNLKFGINGSFQMPGDANGPNHSFKPSFMFDAAIQKFAPMSLQGVLWYQGESNADNRNRIEQYSSAFPVLVSSYRDVFQKSDLPFIFVQLPGLERPYWPIFREQQRRSLAKLSHVGMAIAIDVGHPTNVHPTTKQPVGERLAAWALSEVYQKAQVAMGPLFSQKNISQSSTLNLTFEHVGDGLKTTDGTPPRHFEIAGSDGEFYPAAATISRKNEVALKSKQVLNPVHARYAWAPYPRPPVNLINSAKLPASPFSTKEEF